MSTKNLFTIERLLDLPSSRPSTIDLTANPHMRKRRYDSFSVGESDKDSASGDEGMLNLKQSLGLRMHVCIKVMLYDADVDVLTIPIIYKYIHGFFLSRILHISYA